MRRVAAVLLALIAGILAGTAVVRTQDTAQSEKGYVEGLVQRLLSSEGRPVDVDGISISLTGDVTARRVAVRDLRGEWLVIEDFVLDWQPLSLFTSTLRIDAVTASRLTVLRRPEAAPAAETPSEARNLTAAVISRLAVDEVKIERPVIGQPATLTVKGSARISQSPAAVSLDLAATRTDQIDGRLVAGIVFDRDTGELRLDVVLSEDSGGLVQRLLALQGEPALDLRLAGRGPIGDWSGDLRLSLNGEPVITGTTRLAAVDGGTMIETTVSGAFDAVAPEALDPLFAGPSELAATVLFDDAGALRIDSAVLRSEAMELAADGLIDLAASDLVVSLTGQLAFAEPVELAAGEILRMAFEARLQGALDRPEWALNATAESLRVAGFAGSDLTLEADGTGLPLSADRRAVIKILASGVLQKTDEDDLPPIIEGPFGVALTLDLPGSGRVVLEEARLEADSTVVTASGHYTPADRQYELTLEAAAQSPKTGNALLDRLLQGHTRLAGRVSGTAPGPIQLHQVTLTSEVMDGRVSGRVDEEIELTANAVIQNLSGLHPRASGTVEVEARLAGSKAAPRIEVKGSGREVRLMGKPFRDVAFEAAGVLDQASPAGEIKLTGELDGRPVDIAAAIVGEPAGGGPRLNLAAAVGAALIEGNLVLPDAAPPRGRLKITAPDLSHLGPLLLAELAGSLDAEIELADRNGRSIAEVSADGRRIAYGAITADTLSADLVIEDLFGTPHPSGDVRLRELRVGAFDFAAVDLEAKPLDERSFAVAVDAAGQRLRFTARATTVVDRGTFLITTEKLSGTLDGTEMRLIAPVLLTVAEDAVSIGRAEIAVGPGRIVLAGALSPSLDGRLEARDIPLAVAASAMPDLAPAGTVTGTATLSGSIEDPEARFSLTGRDVSLAPLREQGLPPLALEATGEYLDRRLTFTSTATGPGRTELAISGVVTATERPQFDVAMRGSVSSALVAERLAEAGLRLDAQLSVDLRLTGSPGDIAVAGTVAASDATFGDIDGRFIVRRASGRMVIADEVLRIERLEGATGSNGRASISGTVALGTPHEADLSIEVDRGHYSDGTLLVTAFDARLAVTGPLRGTPKISGRVELIGPKLTLSEPPPVALIALEVTHRHAPPEVRRQAASLAARRAGHGGDVELAVEIRVRDRFTVRGRGLNAELGGRLTLTGPLSDPQAVGGFRVVRGHMDLLGRRIEIDSGRLDFIGNFDPRLEFSALARREDVEIRLMIAGRATEPRITVTSSPELPQEEALARLVFGTSLTQLSPLQVAQLAAAVATLSGGAGGGLFEGLGLVLGLDRFEVYQSETGATTVAVGRRITERVSLGLEQGAEPGSTRVHIDIDITRNIKARGSLGRDGSSKAGLFFVKDY